MASRQDPRLGTKVDLTPGQFPADAEHEIAGAPTLGPEAGIQTEHPPEPTPPSASARPEGTAPAPPAPPAPPAGAAPPAPPTPPAPPQAEVEVAPPPVRDVGPDHAVLATLKRDLGLVSTNSDGVRVVHSVDVELHGHVFRIVKRSWEDTIWALGHAQITGDEHIAEFEFQAAVAAVSISAIDGTPVWEIFRGYVPFEFDAAAFAHEDYPDTGVRHAVAEELRTMLVGDGDTVLDALVADRVFTAYRRNFGLVGLRNEEGVSRPTTQSASPETDSSVS